MPDPDPALVQTEDSQKGIINYALCIPEYRILSTRLVNKSRVSRTGPDGRNNEKRFKWAA